MRNPLPKKEKIMSMIEGIPYQLSDVEIPDSFSSRKKAQETVDGVYGLEKLTIPQLESEKLEKIHVLLTHPNLDKLISAGRISLGMIKPHASDGRGMPGDDDEAAQIVLDEIQQNVVFSLPLKFRKKEAEKFYGHLKDKLVDEPEVYDSIINFTSSSGLTVVLIYKKDAGMEFELSGEQQFFDGSTLFPDGHLHTKEGEVELSKDTVVFEKNGKPVVKNVSEMSEEEKNEFSGRRKYYLENGQVKIKIENAIIWWRDKMGDTRPEDARFNNPESIRARYSVDLPNNITHGSDSIESVNKEIAIIDEVVVSFVAQNKKNVKRAQEPNATNI